MLSLWFHNPWVFPPSCQGDSPSFYNITNEELVEFAEALSRIQRFMNEASSTLAIFELSSPDWDLDLSWNPSNRIPGFSPSQLDTINRPNLIHPLSGLNLILDIPHAISPDFIPHLTRNLWELAQAFKSSHSNLISEILSLNFTPDRTTNGASFCLQCVFLAFELFHTMHSSMLALATLPLPAATFLLDNHTDYWQGDVSASILSHEPIQISLLSVDLITGIRIFIWVARAMSHFWEGSTFNGRKMNNADLYEYLGSIIFSSDPMTSEWDAFHTSTESMLNLNNFRIQAFHTVNNFIQTILISEITQDVEEQKLFESFRASPLFPSLSDEGPSNNHHQNAALKRLFPSIHSKASSKVPITSAHLKQAYLKKYIKDIVPDSSPKTPSLMNPVSYDSLLLMSKHEVARDFANNVEDQVADTAWILTKLPTIISSDPLVLKLINKALSFYTAISHKVPKKKSTSSPRVQKSSIKR
jgi:hypothetical protein